MKRLSAVLLFVLAPSLFAQPPSGPLTREQINELLDQNDCVNFPGLPGVKVHGLSARAHGAHRALARHGMG